ncbi:hypothetical protein [uncultured Clostridium sp.]|uniref:hypothetical protein n=1 Tax=uncultured Clostridium sp. TaxID=59620 RepID=UPI0028EC8F02|nr:hypothetical protein [uncultured Clostridium sp.]
MGILANEINFDSLITNLGNCCLTEEKCKSCSKDGCLIAYSKEGVKNCLKNSVSYVENGCENIPLVDTKVYDENNLIIAIADILNQCRSCRENHFDNCVINVLRNCYEVALVGEVQRYKGSTLIYLSDIKNLNPEIGAKIMDKYNMLK